MRMCGFVSWMNIEDKAGIRLTHRITKLTVPAYRMESETRCNIYQVNALLNSFVYYAPNFEEVEGAYWFGPVRPSVRP